jgi:hypothetical protein
LVRRSCSLCAEAPGVGNSEAKLPAEFLGGGDSVVRTAFNPAYLLDAIKTLDSDAASLSTLIKTALAAINKVFAKPALIYDRYNAVVRWVLMPINAGLEATRENLGSNYPTHLDSEEDQQPHLVQVRRPPDETPHTNVPGMRPDPPTGPLERLTGRADFNRRARSRR